MASLGPKKLSKHGPALIDLSEEAGHAPEEQARRSRAAAKITKFMRSRYLMYANFGPLVFCKHDGSTAEFGTILFEARDTRAKFISLADMSSAAMLGNFVEKYWKCAKPEVLISVTGGAQTFDLKPWLKRAFEAGFVRAANDAKAWIVTGGTDAGVMELVATAMHNHNISLPIFGFTPLGCVNGRHLLNGCRREHQTVHYDNVGKASAKGAPLNPHHSHFVLVDSGKEAPAAWGSEIGLRYSFENFYSTQKHVPIVQVVVQGGPGTLDNMLHAAQKSCPIVIVAESGGAATAVYRFCNAEVPGELEEDVWFEDELMKKFEKKRLVFEQLLRLHQEHDGRLLNFFSPLGETDADGDNDMSTMLLNSIVKMIRAPRHSEQTAAHGEAAAGGTDGSPPRSHSIRAAARQTTSDGDVPPGEGERALMLAVKWNRPDVVRSILEELPGGLDFRKGHKQVVQAALELQRTDIVTLLIRAPSGPLRLSI
tara:strand:- start:825 stop:2270 length:1446 start_codon:yes stop_codon:yes gene_type:complete